jgi:hypothetical protein
MTDIERFNKKKASKFVIYLVISVSLLSAIIVIVTVLPFLDIGKDPIIDNWGTYSSLNHVGDNGLIQGNESASYDFVTFEANQTFFSYDVFNKINSTGGQELDYFIVKNGTWKKTGPDSYTISTSETVIDSSYLILDKKTSSDIIAYDKNTDQWYSISNPSYKYYRLTNNSQITHRIIQGLSTSNMGEE